MPKSEWQFVLASQSPARLRLMKAAGLNPLVKVSDVDEDAVAAALGDSLPAATSQALARAKAESVSAGSTGKSRLVIGADSILDVDGEAYGKPKSLAQARDRLNALMGRTAVLHTGHWVVRCTDAVGIGAVVSTEVRFGSWTRDEIHWYLSTGEALNVAGGFTLDGMSAPFVDGVVGDPGNVIGLSLPKVRQLIASLGVAWPELF